MLSLTPTKLRDFLTCPQMYKLRHISRVGVDSNPTALSFGRSLHAALEELHRVTTVDGIVAEPDHVLKRHWEPDAYTDKQDSAAHFAKGCDALRRYLGAHPPLTAQVLGTEVFMAHVINVRGLPIRLGCKADRVGLLPGGVLEILDYKTNASGRVPTRESLSSDLPTFLYYLLARISYPQYDRVKVTFLNLLNLASVGVEYETVQVTANKQALLTHIRAFAAETFEPRPSEACAWCSVQDHCPIFRAEIDFDNLT